VRGREGGMEEGTEVGRYSRKRGRAEGERDGVII